MKRLSSIRNLVLLATLAASALALGGCLAQGPAPDDHSQTDNEPRHAELVGVENGASGVAHSQAGLAISGSTPLGAANIGPQPEPWTGRSSSDPNGGPQPEPWKPKKLAPNPDTDTSSASAPK